MEKSKCVRERKRDAHGGHAPVYSSSKEEGRKFKAHVRLWREREREERSMWACSSFFVIAGSSALWVGLDFSAFMSTASTTT